MTESYLEMFHFRSSVVKIKLSVLTLALLTVGLAVSLTMPLKVFAQTPPPANAPNAQENSQEVSEEAVEEPARNEENSIDALLESIGNATQEAEGVDQGELSDSDVQSRRMVPESVSSQEAIAEIPDAPPPQPPLSADDNIFFDAQDLAPRQAVQRSTEDPAPRRVDPREDQASKILIIRSARSSNSQDAQIVAAERAMKLGRYEAALEIYERLHAQNKMDQKVLMGRAIAYQKLDRNDFAVLAYEELLDSYPDNVEAQINMLGIISSKFPSVASRQLLDLREVHPQNVGIVAQIAMTKAAMKNYTEAVRYLGIAASMEPENPSHIYNMAVVADIAGSREDAISFYEQSLQVDTLNGASSIPRDAIFERLADLR